MRYKLSFKPGVNNYLLGLSLTREGRIRLNDSLIDVAQISDQFRTDPANRAGVFFFFRRLFMDAGRLRTLFLAVDDSAAAYGVLTIAYADLQ